MSLFPKTLNSRELFDILGVTRQRAKQCAKCPDGRQVYSVEEANAIRATLKPHRCHETPDRLCAGPLRPRPLMSYKDHRQAMMHLEYMGLSNSVASKFVRIARRMPFEGCALLLKFRLAERRR